MRLYLYVSNPTPDKYFMMQLIIALIVIVGIWAAMAKIRRLPPEQKKKALWRFGLWGGSGLLLLMVATGRAHWLFAVIGGLFPLLKVMLGMGLQLFPLWRQRQQAKQQGGSNASAAPRGGMSIREAMDTLGLKGPENEITREQVISAHRKLMQKLHPDRGGNDFLAAKVNEAKEQLIRHIG